MIAAPPLDAAAALFFVVALIVTALLTYRRPAVGLAALVAADPFALTRYVGHTTISTFKIALIGVLIGLAARRALVLPREAAPRFTLLVLVAVVIATAATIPHAAFRAPAIRETLKAVEYLVVFLAAWWASREDPDAASVIGTAFVVVMAVVALDALRDYASPQSGVWIGGKPITRVAGHLEGPNQLASWLAIAFSAAIGGVTSDLLLALTVSLGAAALVLTLSRGGVMQGVLTLVAAGAARGHGAARMFAICAITCGVALGALAYSSRSGDAPLSRMTSAQASVDLGGTGTRAILWHAAFAMFEAHPLLGVGAGNFEFELPRYGAPSRVRTQANSLYLESLADGGVVLGLMTIAAAAVPPILLLRQGRRVPFVLAAGVAGAALALHGVIDDVTFYTKVGQAWWVLAGCAAAIRVPSSAAPPAACRNYVE